MPTTTPTRDTVMTTDFFELERHDDVGVVWLDRHDRSVNAISRQMLRHTEELLTEVEQDETLQALVFISRKPDSFIVGADVHELDEMMRPSDVEAMSRLAHRVILRLKGLRKPTVAAIHGPAMGGGLEMALACTYRVASNHPKTKLALPEVKLGLLPGGGGTQYLPRLVGLQQALPIMLTGKNVYPKKAKRIGLVDVLTHRDGLLHAARSAARALADGSLRPDRDPQNLPARLLESTPLTRRIIYRKATEQVEEETRGNYPAPYRVIECARIGLESGIHEGLDAEARAFGELAFTPQSEHLRFLFFAKQRAEKNPLDDATRAVRRAGVLGAGLMGAGIAAVTASGEIDVVLKDQSLELAAGGKRTVWKELEKNVGKGALTPFDRDATLERVRPSSDYNGFEHLDLVIEAVPEDLGIKHAILQETENVVPDTCVFASNTSSIPITQIAEAAERPENVVGMHYFSPVPQMPLLEIIKTRHTSEAALATAFAAGLRQGKTVIAVNDGPGFYTTRILAVYMNEALELLNDHADARQVDDVMQSFGFPMGPFELFDLVGIDTAAKITDVLGPFFHERGIEPHDGAARLADADRLGQKSGRGFYTYDDSEKKEGFDDRIYAFFGGTDRRRLHPEAIQQRMALAMVNEAARCLDEGILESAEDGDVGAVFGLGFPPFRGGPFHYVDSETASAIVNRLERLRQQHGTRFTPSELLRQHARTNERFFSR